MCNAVGDAQLGTQNKVWHACIALWFYYGCTNKPMTSSPITTIVSTRLPLQSGQTVPYVPQHPFATCEHSAHKCLLHDEHMCSPTTLGWFEHKGISAFTRTCEGRLQFMHVTVEHAAPPQKLVANALAGRHRPSKRSKLLAGRCHTSHKRR